MPASNVPTKKLTPLEASRPYRLKQKATASTNNACHGKTQGNLTGQRKESPQFITTVDNEDGSEISSLSPSNHAKRTHDAATTRANAREYLRDTSTAPPDIASSIMMNRHMRDDTPERNSPERTVKRSYSSEGLYGRAGKIRFQPSKINSSDHGERPTTPNLQLRSIPTATKLKKAGKDTPKLVSLNTDTKRGIDERKRLQRASSLERREQVKNSPMMAASDD